MVLSLTSPLFHESQRNTAVFSNTPIITSTRSISGTRRAPSRNPRYGVKWAWVIVQHADTRPEWQASLLAEFEKRFEAAELPADLFAKLTDRVLLKQHQPQRFGTQFDWLSGHFNPRGAIDIAQIDAHRSAIGLMPLADYACLVNQKLSSREP